MRPRDAGFAHQKGRTIWISSSIRHCSEVLRDVLHPSGRSRADEELIVNTVGIAIAPGACYWLADSHGGAYRFGDAALFGSMDGLPLNQPTCGIASTTTGLG